MGFTSFVVRALGVFGAIAAGAGWSRPARACGGYFVPQTPDRPTVTDHRMAFSISTTQSVLWDQIRYIGRPQDFAWVLPVKPGARLEVSNDAWFAALDATTQPVVLPPPNPTTLPTTPGGCLATGCGGDNSAPGTSQPGPVQVLSQGVAGIYDTVTLQSSDPNALENWLRQNGYDVPQSILPMLRAYISEGFDFIALRMRPECGASAMQPVRVITPGADLSLPLRMVAAGVATHVGVTLYVISEGRYHPQNFPDALVDYSRLAMSEDGTSNYEALVASAITASGGNGWVTEYSGPVQLQQGDVVPDASKLNPGFAEAYFGACSSPSNDAGLVVPCPDAGGAASDAGSDASDASSDAAATGSKPSVDADTGVESGADGGDSGDAAEASEDRDGSDASEEPSGEAADGGDASDGEGLDVSEEPSEDASEGGEGRDAEDGGALDASEEPSDEAGAVTNMADAGGPSPPPFAGACASFDDLDVALSGLTPSNVWVTRMRSDLPVSALAVDLVLEAAPSQTHVPNLHQAIPPGATPGTSCESAPRVEDAAGSWLVVLVAGLGMGVLMRRRRRS